MTRPDDDQPTPSPEALFAPWTAQLRTTLTPTHVNELTRDGYTVIDDFWTPPIATALRTELDHLTEHDLWLPNRTHFVTAQSQPMETTKPDIYEVDMHSLPHRKALPNFAYVFSHITTQIAARLQALDPSLAMALGPAQDHHTVKLQRNAGHGGCFPLHYDNPGPPNQRKITMLTYLNPSWQDGDGGELQLVPFLRPPVRLAPTMDRVVLFAADTVLHRVLPARVPRLCFTVWMDGEQTNRAEDLTLRSAGGGVEATVNQLRNHPAQRLVTRCVYREAFEASLRACMRGRMGEKEMIAAHEKHVTQAQANGGLWRLVCAMRDYHELLQLSEGWELVL
jgi:hypothetical protein